ncbi:MAG: restriction endonuclease [Alteromonas sp.]|jgi:HJR/Mrr/RecB family endonuclease|uniref:restriction endonuclease n=1 Tax=Alteromonas sp. TaxID=232 RepID=UPI0032D99B6B
MSNFFSKITGSFVKALHKSGDSLNSVTEKVQAVKSSSQYRDLKNGLLNSGFIGMKDDIQYVISKHASKDEENLYLSDLIGCLNDINKVLSGDSSIDKKALIISVYANLHNFLISGYLQENYYLKPLSRKYRQLLCEDDYGDIDVEPWVNETRRFALKHTFEVNDYIEEHTTYELRNRYLSYGEHMVFRYEADKFTMLDHHIEQVVEAFMEQKAPDNYAELSSITDPYEYERTIADTISSTRAKARVTQGSGDQGADVIANFLGEDYIIQCKLYSQPVGNKAVQEVAAAKQFYDGDYALVVTNSSFTKSARQLADKLGVMLLHHSQLADVFGEGDSNSTNVPSEESCSYEVMMEALNSYDTERLKEHASEFLDIFEPAISENMFVFDVGDCSAFVACFASDDEDVFRTYIDYLFKLTDGLSYDEKILFTFDDVEEDTLKFADDLDIRLFTDEKILDYLQGLIDIHIDEE